jgi:hypothetical protein
MRPAFALVIALTIAAAPRPAAAQRLAPNSFPRMELAAPTTQLAPGSAAIAPGSAAIVPNPTAIVPNPTTSAAVVPAARSADGDVAGMILGAVTLGTAGLFAGGMIGNRFQSHPCEDCLEGPFYGALAGVSLAIPAGVHLANHGRGTLGPSVAASLGIGALGFGAAALTDNWGLLLAIPVLQIAASIGIEQHTTRD